MADLTVSKEDSHCPIKSNSDLVAKSFNLLNKINIGKFNPKQKISLEGVRKKPLLKTTKEKPNLIIDTLPNIDKISAKTLEKSKLLFTSKLMHRRNFSEIIKQQNSEKIQRKKISFKNLATEESAKKLSRNKNIKNNSRPSSTNGVSNYNQSFDILIQNNRNKVLIESSFRNEINKLNTSNMSIKFYNSVEENENQISVNSIRVQSINKSSSNLEKRLYTNTSHSDLGDNTGNKMFNTETLKGSNHESVHDPISLLKNKQIELKKKIEKDEFNFFISKNEALNDENSLLYDSTIFEELLKNLPNGNLMKNRENFIKTENEKLTEDYNFRIKKEVKKITPQSKEDSIKEATILTNPSLFNKLNKKFIVVRKDLVLNTNFSPTSHKHNFSTASTTSNKTKFYMNDSKYDIKPTEKYNFIENKNLNTDPNKPDTPQLSIKEGKKFSIMDVDLQVTQNISKKFIESLEAIKKHENEVDNTKKINFALSQNSRLEHDSENNTDRRVNENCYLIDEKSYGDFKNKLELDIVDRIKQEEKIELDKVACKIQNKFRNFMKKKEDDKNILINDNFEKLKENLQSPQLKTQTESPQDGDKSKIVKKPPLLSLQEINKQNGSSLLNLNNHLNFHNDQAMMLSSIRENDSHSPSPDEIKIKTIQSVPKNLKTLSNSNLNNSKMTFNNNEYLFENSFENIEDSILDKPYRDTLINYMESELLGIDENFISDDISTKTINTQSFEEDEELE